MAAAPVADTQQQKKRAPKPRRRPGSGNIYKRADGRCWEGRLRVDGKLYRVYARTERAAEHEVASLRAKIAGGQVSAPGSEPVAQYLERWLTIAGPSLAPRTMAFYRQLVRDHIVPVIGRVRLDRLDPSDVQRMIAEASHRELSPATIQRIRATLRAALSMAMRWGLVVRNVANW